jgi:hypothetical protein
VRGEGTGFQNFLGGGEHLTDFPNQKRSEGNQERGG